jgi:outer membrane immunogenic protein
MVPPPPAPPLWTGVYVGLNAGGTWTDEGAGYTTNWAVLGAPGVANALLSGPLPSSNASGFIGGGQIGYNLQFGGTYVVGVEADIQGVARSGGSNTASSFVNTSPGGGTVFVSPPVDALTTVTARQSLDYLGTVRGRLGWLFTPTLLMYGTGGLAYGGGHVTVDDSQLSYAGSTLVSLNYGSGSFSDTRVGWSAGGGVEWMFWPNWSAKVEYLRYDLGTVRASFTNYEASTGLPGSISEFSTRFSGNLVRAGLNYHFNWGAPAPVVAKY